MIWFCETGISLIGVLITFSAYAVGSGAFFIALLVLVALPSVYYFGQLLCLFSIKVGNFRWRCILLWPPSRFFQHIVIRKRWPITPVKLRFLRKNSTVTYTLIRISWPPFWFVWCAPFERHYFSGMEAFHWWSRKPACWWTSSCLLQIVDSALAKS